MQKNCGGFRACLLPRSTGIRTGGTVKVPSCSEIFKPHFESHFVCVTTMRLDLALGGAMQCHVVVLPLASLSTCFFKSSIAGGSIINPLTVSLFALRSSERKPPGSLRNCALSFSEISKVRCSTSNLSSSPVRSTFILDVSFGSLIFFLSINETRCYIVR